MLILSPAAIHTSAFHHEHDPPHGSDVLKRISVGCDQVCLEARRYRAVVAFRIALFGDCPPSRTR
jgi:hypothetical protein